MFASPKGMPQYLASKCEPGGVLNCMVKNFTRLALHVDKISFDQLVTLITQIEIAWAESQPGKSLEAMVLSGLRGAAGKWTSKTDRRRVLLWLLGLFWERFERFGPIFEDLAAIFHEFLLQPEGERDVLRSLFGSDEDDRLYKSLPDKIDIYSGGLWPAPLLRLNYTRSEKIAEMEAYVARLTFDKEIQPNGRPHVYRRLVPKSSIVGFKSYKSHFDADECIVAAPFLPGTCVREA